MPERIVKMKPYDIFYPTAILLAGILLFGCFLFMMGIYDISIGGTSDAARFAGWVVNAIR
jgi:ABC-type multidrug transport system permease subunit